MESKKPAKVLAVTSGKGGVGKTTFVLNLALSLQKRGKRVLIFDADAGLGNVHVFLGLNPELDLSHVVRGEKSLKDIVLRTSYGFSIIPAPSGVEELSQLSGPLKMEIVNEADDLGEDIDYMIIDTAAGISSNVTYFCAASQEIVVVVTPEPTSILNAYSLIKILHTGYGEKRFRIVVNIAKDREEGKRTFLRIAEAAEGFLGLSLDLLGILPEDGFVKRSTLERKLVVDAYPQSPYSASMAKLAMRVESLGPPKPKGSIQFFWKKLLEA